MGHVSGGQGIAGCEVNAATSASRGAEFLDKDLQREAGDFGASELRELANTFERWAAQLRFKADAMDGSADAHD